MAPNLENNLQKYFGYTSFRPLQKEIVTDLLNKKDVFTLMPTGGGKSLCYQLPATLQPGLTIVISPLISLMLDQVTTLNQNGIAAAFLNSTISQENQSKILQQCKIGKIKLLYLSPERLVKQDTLEKLKSFDIHAIAIDEAHCISHWGHDFRPEYRELSIIRTQFPQVPIIALTATATPRVKDDIIAQLALENPSIYQASFNRPNLSYYVYPKLDSFNQMLEYIKKHHTEAGIIYCQSRKKVENIVEKLLKYKITALPYHAGLEDIVRAHNQNQFIHEDANIIVATIAFGMGINKPNVRYVIHYDLPKSLENYYQETGRAGRDGLPSECLFFFSIADKFVYEHFIEESKSEKEKTIARHHLNKVINYAQSDQCRRKQLLSHFHEDYPESNCHSCDNCISPPETFDATEITQKILSAIYKTGQRFGPNHIIEVLTGSKSEKVTKFRHDQLSVYNIVKDYNRKQLKNFIIQLINLNVLEQSDDEFVTLTLTSHSAPILKGGQAVNLVKPRHSLEDIQSKSDTKLGTYTSCEYPMNKELFEILRKLRKTLADKHNLPPYIIFPDASLVEMATYFPQTTDQFENIYGIGQQKLATHVPIFQKEITSYCNQHKIEPILKTKKTKKK